MDIPVNFPYMYAYQAGRPVHDHDEFSRKKPKMERGHRAKIFAPFDALDGFENMIGIKNVVCVPQTELSEDEIAVLDKRLKVLAKLTASGSRARDSRVEVTAEYYVPCEDIYNDAYGKAGVYKTVTGICWKVDKEEQTVMIGESWIPFSRIRALNSRIFKSRRV